MEKPKVLVTRMIPDIALESLQEVCDVTLWPHADVPATRSFIEEQITDMEGLYCLLTEKIDDNLLEKAPKLRAISTMAVGYNHIDVKAATERGILVTNTPGVLTETTADLTFSLLMATARRVTEASEYLRKGQWETWSPLQLTGQDVFGSTLGIIGLGRIGEAVARRASGFDMKLLYYNRTRKVEAEQEYGLQYADMERLLKESDYVVILTPYTPETNNLITMKQLRLMKPTSILINSARGGIVNEPDLYEALKQGVIWAAGLDVFDVEPIALEHPLLTLPNVVALPHIGSASIGTRTRMAKLAVDNLLQILSGQRPSCLINPEVLC